jgi:hypothetical protein
MTSYPAFPTLSALRWAAKRSPVASTLRQKAISGRETFQPLWSAPLWKYEISLDALNAGSAALGGLEAGEYQTLVGFRNEVMFAPGGVFAFDDVNDNAVAAQANGEGDGSTTEFQLVRSLGGFAEPVLNPVQGPSTPSASVNYGNCQGSTTGTISYGDCQGAITSEISYGYCSLLQVFVAGSLATSTLFAGGVIRGEQVQLRQDTTTNVLAITPAEGEVIYDVTRKALTVGDGATAGGNTVTPIAGSWTPQLAFGGASVGMTASVATGSFVQIGPLIICTFEITLTAKGSSTGAATITGLPTACTPLSGACMTLFHANLATSPAFEHYVQATSSAITLGKSGGTSWAALADTDFTNTSQLNGVAIYQAAQPTG